MVQFIVRWKSYCSALWLCRSVFMCIVYYVGTPYYTWGISKTYLGSGEGVGEYKNCSSPQNNEKVQQSYFQ